MHQTKPPLNLIRLRQVPILEQLQLEEALLRCDQQNWCIINEGAPPAIVMGISGKPELLLNLEKLNKKPIPLIKRFSGGGTVVINESTLFVTLICNTVSTNVSCCPNKVLEWSKTLYLPIIPGFELRDNDYTIGDRKFGGNALYLCKERWLLHSSLLWDFLPEQMEYLSIPAKQPKYRANRNHTDFLCSLKNHFADKTVLKTQLLGQLNQLFSLEKQAYVHLLHQPHRKTTQKLESIAF